MANQVIPGISFNLYNNSFNRGDNSSVDTTSDLDIIKKIWDNLGLTNIDNKIDYYVNLYNTTEDTPKPIKQKITPKKQYRKFKIGERYALYPMNNKKLKREYVVKKTINSIRDKEVHVVIMKQVSGSQTTKYTLNKRDCLKYHLKFEEGLEVFSMGLDWKLIKQK